MPSQHTVMMDKQAHRPQTTNDNGSLVDRLIDSELEWRQLICEANAGSSPSECLRNLSELQIKRQEVIHELIKTERHHCLTLALMRQVYLSGLLKLNAARSSTANGKAAEAPLQDLIDLERLFPALEDLIQAHELLFAHLRLKLVQSCNEREPRSQLIGLVGPLGELLVEQFQLTAVTRTAVTEQEPATVLAKPEKVKGNGHKLLQAYAKFCGQHYDSSRYYKHLMQSDKGFKQFIEQCNRENPACRQRGILECNLLVTQRLTKYPLLIEQLIKTSKEDANEEERLKAALAECKALLAELNNQLARKESFERLLEIYALFCPKSYTVYNRHLKFTKHDLLQHKRLRQLIHSDAEIRIWSATRRKLFQVLCLILNDIVVFLRVEQTAPTTSSSGAHLLDLQPLSLPTNSNEGSLTNNHQQDHQQQTHLIGQCALINVVAQALHQTQSSHSPMHQSQQQVGLNPSMQQQQQQQQQSNNLNANGSPLSHHLVNLKYFFANIDNKSSVISLSKLLIREKAANEGQPRVYLISSSPRQPEMYELAFVSKRHQASFVDKLKACIETHTRNLIEGADEDAIDDLLLDDSDDDCCRFYGNSSSNNINSRPLSDEENNNTPPDSDDGRSELSCQLEEDLSLFDCCHAANKSATTATGTRNNGVSGSLEQLDIEQDVIEEREEHQEEERQSDETMTSAAADSSTTTVSHYETPRACLANEDDGKAAEKQAVDNNSDSDDEDEELLANNCSLNGSNLSERAKDSLDEGDDSLRFASTSSSLINNQSATKLKMKANRRRRAARPRNVSNQSTSSSEAAAAAATTGRHDAGSQEQAKQLTATAPGNGEEDEFDSGRGHDSSSSAASTSSLNNQREQKRPECEEANGNSGSKRCQANGEEPVVVKLSKNISLSTSSISSKSSASQHNSSNHSANSTLKTNAGIKSPSIKSSKSVINVNSPQSTSGDIGLARTPIGQDSSSLRVLKSGRCKSCCCSTSSSSCSSSCPNNNLRGHSMKQQRKLSTVSTMSSQLKLLSKLKSSANFLANHHGHHHQSCCVVSGSCKLAANNGDYCHEHNNQSNQSTLLSHQAATLSKQLRQQMRRSTFIPEQKLEELRDLRIQLDKDKQEWQMKFNRMQEQLLTERRELDLAREKLKLDKIQVANEREQLYRKLDLLKERGILLSPSHKVIITAPDLIMQQHQQLNAENLHQFQQQQLSSHLNQQQLIKQRHLQTVNVTNSSQNPGIRIVQPNQNSPYSVNIINHCQQSQLDNQSQVTSNCNGTNLFIQSQPAQQQQSSLINQAAAGPQQQQSANNKVPLHLSEQMASRVSSTLGLSKFPPLMQALSSSFSGGSSNQAMKLSPSSSNSSPSSSTRLSNNQYHLESHLI